MKRATYLAAFAAGLLSLPFVAIANPLGAELVLAQDRLEAISAPSLEVFVISAAPATVDPENLEATAAALLTAVTSGDWTLVAVLAIVLVTLALRRWGSGLFPWLGSRWAGVLLPLLGAAAASVATALVGGIPLTAGLVLKAILVGITAIGAHSATKNIGQAMGVVAANHVQTKPQALQALDPRG